MGPRFRGDDVLRVLFGLVGLIVAWSLGASSAQAHPHVWISAKSEVVYAPDGSIAWEKQFGSSFAFGVACDFV